MKNGIHISKRELDAAVLKVQGELTRLGLWNEGSRLHRADVIWCAFPQWPPKALGFFIHSSPKILAAIGYRPGHLYIPALVLGRRNVLDVVRHEYAHALAHYYPLLIQRSRAFTAAFGGRYSSGTPLPGSERAQDFVSAYAATEPCEDFAETFMVYLRRKGKPLASSSRAITRKWKFIVVVVANIRRGAVR